MRVVLVDARVAGSGRCASKDHSHTISVTGPEPDTSSLRWGTRTWPHDVEHDKILVL